MTTSLRTSSTTVINKWKPHKGPQEFALRQPTSIYEILFGGARGPGKTDAGLVWVGHRRWKDANDNWRPAFEHPRYRALVIRKNADDLSDWIERFRFMYQDAKVGYRPYEIRFPSGAYIRTGHLKDEQAYTKYQGHEYHSILIEELTQIPMEKRYIQLISSCRSTIPELRPQIFNTTNPGGKGHSWVKKRFVAPAPPNTVFEDEEGSRRIFIPAGVEDNPTLIENDPNYVKQLDGIKNVDPDLYKAWRLGSWDVIAGQAFREFNYNEHVLDGITRKMEYSLDVCKKIITFDWGYTAKGVAHWLALTPENHLGVRHLYVYREIVRTETEPKDWAKLISNYTRTEKVDYMVLPHDCFAHKESKKTIASTFSREIKNGEGKINIKRGDTLKGGARINRKAMTHLYLATSRDGKPYLQIHPACTDLIESLPELQIDEKNIEDIDTSGNDHSYDSVSLGLTSMGYVPEGSSLLSPVQKIVKAYPSWHTDKSGNIPAPNFWKEFDRQKEIKSRDSEPL